MPSHGINFNHSESSTIKEDFYNRFYNRDENGRLGITAKKVRELIVHHKIQYDGLFSILSEILRGSEKFDIHRLFISTQYGNFINSRDNTQISKILVLKQELKATLAEITSSQSQADEKLKDIMLFLYKKYINKQINTLPGELFDNIKEMLSKIDKINLIFLEDTGKGLPDTYAPDAYVRLYELYDRMYFAKEFNPTFLKYFTTFTHLLTHLAYNTENAFESTETQVYGAEACKALASEGRNLANVASCNEKFFRDLYVILKLRKVIKENPENEVFNELYEKLYEKLIQKPSFLYNDFTNFSTDEEILLESMIKFPIFNHKTMRLEDSNQEENYSIYDFQHYYCPINEL